MMILIIAHAIIGTDVLGGDYMNEQQVISYIKKRFPNTPTDYIAKKVNLSSFQVRTIAKNNNVKKCRQYIKQQRKKLIEHRKRWYEASIPKFKPTIEQEQIILGSLLGDGGINKGGNRSINYYYQEHFGQNQRKYRVWKSQMLDNLSFNITGNYLRSNSHPYFTNLYAKLYKNNIKILTDEFLSKCFHPLFLATLYLDDGSLTISYTYNKNKNIVYCQPSIILYTLNFTKKENERLANHLNIMFKTSFVVSKHPDGNQHLLKLNKQSEVAHLLKVIEPYVADIPSMHYKTNITENVRLKMNHIYKKFNDNVTIKLSSSNRRRPYSKEEINKMINLKKRGKTDKEIAMAVNRTYWSVVYKCKELRKKGVL